MVLVTVLASTTGVVASLNAQHANTIVANMIKSSEAQVLACDAELDGNWPAGNYVLSPNTNCLGVVQPGLSAFVSESSNYQATYSTDVQVTSSGVVTSISVESSGQMNLLRTSTGLPWRTYASVRKIQYRPTVVTSVALARTHSCTLLGDRSVYCTGANAHGQLGDGTTAAATVPTKKFILPSNVSALRVITDEKQSCVITSDNQLYCAGDNSVGQLGDGTTINRSTAVRFAIPAGRVVVDAQIGRDLYGPGTLDEDTSTPYTCALTTLTDGSSGQLYCAGANQFGQLGVGNTINQYVPVRFGLSSGTVTSFAVGPSDGATSADGHSHTCVITNSSTVFCAGRGVEGQLGNGATSNQSNPVRFGSSISNARSVHINYRETCVILQTNALMCAGENRVGRFGNASAVGGIVNQPTAAFTSGISGSVSKIEMGPNQNCVLTSTSRAFCAGYGAYGRLGNNSSANSSTPVQFATAGTGTNLTDMRIGDIHTCVLTTTQKVFCAGANTDGHLGVGYFSPGQSSSNPYPAEGEFILPSGVLAQLVIPGPRSTCVLTTLGKSYCSGANTYGQLGNNVTENQSTPIRSLLIDPAPLFY